MSTPSPAPARRAGGPPPAITQRRVAITGMSVATALGLEVDGLWRALLAGACGISPLPPEMAGPELPVRIAGQVDDAALAAGLARYAIDERDRSDRLGLYVVGRALEDAGHPTDGAAPLGLDVIVGSGHGGVAVSNAAVRAYMEGGWRRGAAPPPGRPPVQPPARPRPPPRPRPRGPRP